MTWIVIVSLVCSLRCAFVARNGRTGLAFHRLNGYDFAVLTPDDGELQEKICKFCPKLQNKTSHYLYFVGCLSDYIYITQ
jgi:hypothetical protein